MSTPLSENMSWPTEAILQCERRIAPKNSLLVRVDDPESRVRVIASGWAFRYRRFEDGRRQILNVLLPGDVFGLETLFGAQRNTAVEAVTTVTYHTISPDALTLAFDLSPAFRKRLLEVLLAERAVLEEWLVRLGRCDAEERTGAFLLSLYERLSRAGLTRGDSYTMELTLPEMADVLGLHVIYLKRVLDRLKAQGVLSKHGSKITLHDPDRLSTALPRPEHEGPPPPRLFANLLTQTHEFSDHRAALANAW